MKEQLAQSAENLKNIINSFANTLGSNVVTQTSSLLSQLPAVASAINTANQTIAFNTPVQIDSSFQSVKANLNLEILAKELARTSSNDRIASTVTSITNANTFDLRDTSAIVNEDFVYRQSLVSSISSAGASFSAQESTRAITEANSLNSVSDSASTAMANALASALSTEVARSFSRATVLAAAISPALSTSTGG